MFSIEYVIYQNPHKKRRVTWASVALVLHPANVFAEARSPAPLHTQCTPHSKFDSQVVCIEAL